MNSSLYRVDVTIDAALMAKCPRTTLGCVTAQVEARASPESLIAELNSREQSVLRLPEPRAVLESPQILATRAAYKALGKDPARYRGSAEALLRRVIAGKGLPRINTVVDIINLVSVESRLSIGLYDLAHVQGDIVFRAGRVGETYKGIGKYDLKPDERFGTHHGNQRNEAGVSDHHFVWRQRGTGTLDAANERAVSTVRVRGKFGKTNY